MEASVVPAFEMSCKALFEQIDIKFQNGLVKHTTAIQQQFDSTHSPLAMTLRVCVGCILKAANMTFTFDVVFPAIGFLALLMDSIFYVYLVSKDIVTPWFYVMWH